MILLLKKSLFKSLIIRCFSLFIYLSFTRDFS